MNKMDKPEEYSQFCRSCNHFGFCEVFWGPDCKRQGGTKTPRMKSSTLPSEKIDKAEVKSYPKRTRHRNFLGTEMIRTRVVAW